MQRQHALMVIAACACMLSGSTTTGTTWVWEGDVNNDWNVGGNWDVGSVPPWDEDMRISSGTPNRSPGIYIYASLLRVQGADTVLTVSGGGSYVRQDGEIVVEQGATFHQGTGGHFEVGNFGAGTVRVRDPGSTWTTLHNLYIGRYDDYINPAEVGRFYIENGGYANARNWFIGPVETPGEVYVTGTDSVLEAASDGGIYIGGQGYTARLEVGAGATVLNPGAFEVYSDGTLVMSGGLIDTVHLDVYGELRGHGTVLGTITGFDRITLLDTSTVTDPIDHTGREANLLASNLTLSALVQADQLTLLGNDVMVTPAASFDLSGGALIIRPAVQGTTATLSAPIGPTVGDVEVRDIFTVNLNGPLTNDGSVTIDNDIVDCTVGAPLTVPGAFTAIGSGTFQNTTGAGITTTSPVSDVTISSATVTVDAPINSAKSLNIAATIVADINASLQAVEDVVISGTAAVDIDASVTAGIGEVSIAGDTIALQSGAQVSTPDGLDLSGATSVTIDTSINSNVTDVTVHDSGTLTVNQPVSNLGYFHTTNVTNVDLLASVNLSAAGGDFTSQNSGDFSSSAAGTVTTGAGAIHIERDTVTLGGALSGASVALIGADVDVMADITTTALTLDGTAVDVTASAQINTDTLAAKASDTTLHTGTVVSVAGTGASTTIGLAGTARMTVAGASFDSLGTVVVGTTGANSGELHVSDQGTVSNVDAFVGQTLGTDGSVQVGSTVGTSTWASSGSVYLGGDDTAAGGTATLTVNDGGVVTVAGTTKLWGPGRTLVIDGGSLTTGSYDNTAGGALTFTEGSLTVDAGAFDPKAGDFTLDGTDPTLNLTNGATGSVSGALIVAASQTAVLNVAADSTLNVQGATIGSGGGSGGTVNFDGASSVLMCSGAMVVADQGVGAFDQSAGNVTVTGDLSMGASAGGSGTYAMTGGQVSAANVYLGGSDTIAGGGGTLGVDTGATVNVTDTMKLWTGGRVDLNGGRINLQHLAFGSGDFNFNAGRLHFTGDLIADETVTTGALGPGHVVSTGRHLSVDGAMTLQTALYVDGGELSVGSLINPGGLQFDAGRLNMTSADLVVGAAGLFGPTLRLDAAQHMTVTNNTTVDVSSHMQMAGGVFGSATLTNHGLLSGDGRIEAPLTNAADGEVRAADGDNLIFTAAGNTNAGELRLLGGAMEFDQSLTNSAGGDILGRGTLIVGGQLTNQGDVALSSETTDVFGDVANEAAGRVIISGRADVTFWDDVDHQGAMFKVAADSSATFFGAYSGAGVTGSGHVYFEDDVTPGASPAIATFETNVTLGSSARLIIEIGGTTPGPEYDQLNVIGALDADGTLEVQLIDAGSGLFVPDFNQAFNILSFSSCSGAFTEFDLPDLGATLMWHTSELTVTGDLRTTFMGDITGDTTVGVGDLGVLASQWGTSGSLPLNADLNGDGIVGVGDLGMLAANWGATGGPSLGGARVVPVPSAAVAGGALLIGVGLRRSRRG